MPWCDDCSKYWAPTAMHADGTCPTCGRALEAPEPSADPTGTDAAAADGDRVTLRQLAGEKKAPWHFKLLMVLVVAYLLWRVIQMVGWFVG